MKKEEYKLPEVKRDNFKNISESVTLVSEELLSEEQELLNIKSSKNVFKLFIKNYNIEKTNDKISQLSKLKTDLEEERQKIFLSEIKRDQEKSKENSSNLFFTTNVNSDMEERVSDLFVNVHKLMYITDDLSERISRLEMNAVDEQDTRLSGSTRNTSEVKSQDNKGSSLPSRGELSYALMALLGGAAALDALREMGAFGLGAVRMFKNFLYDLPKMVLYDFPKWIAEQVWKVIDIALAPFKVFQVWVQEKISGIITWMDDAVEKILTGIKTWAKSLIDDLFAPFKAVLEKVSGFVGGIGDSITSKVDDITGAAKGLVTDAWGGVKNNLSKGYDFASDVIISGKDKVVEVVKTSVEAVGSTKAAKYVVEKGTDLIQFGSKKVAAITGPIKEIVESKVMPILTEALTSRFGTKAAAGILKKVPGISILAGLGFGATQLYNGGIFNKESWAKAALEVISGFVASIPPPFNPAAVAASMAIDYYNSTIVGADGDSRTVSSIMADNLILKLSGEDREAELNASQLNIPGSETDEDYKTPPPGYDVNGAIDPEMAKVATALSDSGKTQGYGKAPQVSQTSNVSGITKKTNIIKPEGPIVQETSKNDAIDYNKNAKLQTITAGSAASSVQIVQAPVQNTNITSNINTPAEGVQLLSIFEPTTI